MSHKYDELFNLLRAQREAEMRTVSCATSLGLRKTLKKLEGIVDVTDRISNDVLTKIESAAIEEEIRKFQAKANTLKQISDSLEHGPVAYFSAPTKGTK